VIEQKVQGLEFHATQFDPDWDALKEIKEWKAWTVKHANKKSLKLHYLTDNGFTITLGEWFLLSFECPSHT
jgi:hypothetical protein